MNISKVYQTALDSYGDVCTLVRGLPYQCPNDWEEVLDSLDENSNLYLVKEPDNPKDKLAIAAYIDDRRVGYVAASDNGKIWLYMTDEKMPCTFIEKFDASFKISFKNPRILFEDKPFKEIYRDKRGIIDRPNPSFEVPFLTDSKNKLYEWFDDRIIVADLERAISDFRRKLATRMFIITGRKSSNGEYCYYLPYLNMPIADVEDSLIKKLIDKYGFVIAIPDVPTINSHGGILMDLHVTYLKETNFKEFDSIHQSELVFTLVRDDEDKYQFTADNPYTTDGKDNYDEKQDSEIEEVDMFMQETKSTPSYSKSDYILKKGEVTLSSIEKSTFSKIDKITTELFSFVREILFPSIELFSYLKKHTPYYDQFYDFGQFETLIRVFVIKDLGRIYRGLNHSFNFDTTEGKPLFLYMDKEVGESTDISYEVFVQICDPKPKLKAAASMRELIENQMKSFYEFDIVLWTDTDFIIHSFLKDVNKEWAKRYMELMRQFASVVTDTKGRLADNITDSTSSAFNDFFPLWGITLGKTTWKQAEEMGFPVIKYADGGHSINAGSFSFEDWKGEGVFTMLHIEKSAPVLLKWKSMGFSWDNSYDEWVNVFKTLGYNINVKHQPKVLDGNVLYAVFDAISQDGTLLFSMNFNDGKNGGQTSSPNTLYSITVLYIGSSSSGTSQKNSKTDEKTPKKVDYGEESYSVSDSPEGGKHVSMDVIIPEDGDEDFDFCSYDCSISDKKQISIIKKHMKRYEKGKESRPFIMIGRPLLGTSDMYIFYSLDGEIIFNFIFDEKIKRWIKEAGFVLGKVISYNADEYLPEQLNITLSVSKRKSGETLFKQASNEAMDYIEIYCSSLADSDVEAEIIDAVEKYMSGDFATSYKVVIVPQYCIAICTTLNGENIAVIEDDEIIELAEKNNGAFGYITKVDYDDSGGAWFTIRVSRSIPRFSLD